VELPAPDADGPATAFNSANSYGVDRRKITAVLGRVAVERRRQIGRLVVASFRFPL
jgi:hypothetical protein